MRIARGRGSAELAGLGFVICLAFGCAEGMPGPEASTSRPLSADPFGGSAAPSTGGMGMDTAGTTGGTMTEQPPAFTGQACNMGDSQTCTCEDGVSMGMQACRFEMLSPTKGAFGPCTGCEQQSGPSPVAGTGAAAGMGGEAGMSSAGEGGTMGGTAGMPQSGSGSSGSGGSGSSGSGGSGSSGSGGSGGNDPPERCDPDNCDEPLLGSACCTQDGRCGVRLLLSCNPR